MSAVANRLFRLYQRTTGSIAFVPALITLGLVLLCVVSIALEMTWLQPYKRELDLGLVKNAENARLILGTLVGGVVSLMVFSFSMVMVVLSTAAASLSPRVLPGLISSRQHQVVLGIYLGTIIDSLMLVATIRDGDDIGVPSLGIYLALLLGVVCLCLFIVFIRSVSLAIQVDYNLNRLYKQTLSQLQTQREKLAEFEPPPEWPDDAGWTEIRAQRAGYFKAFNASSAYELLERHDRRMNVLVANGRFLMPGHPLFRLSGPPDETLESQLLDCFDFYVEEYADRHYFFGFKQIAEIATKALSPGVNDPGTALKAIDLLTVLLAERLLLPDFDVQPDDAQPPRIFVRELPLNDVLHAVFGPIRGYGGEDVQVILHLLQAYRSLLLTRPPPALAQALLRHAAAVLHTADDADLDVIDREAINQAVASLDALAEPGQPLEPLR